jgi:hypothetical protein
MHIIFKEHSEEIAKKYIVLDLDTFSLPDGSIHTACCVVENIPITELYKTDDLKKIHAGLLESFGNKEWDQCEEAILELLGKWGGELDTFYTELQSRIAMLKDMDLPDDWSPIIARV